MTRLLMAAALALAVPFAPIATGDAHAQRPTFNCAKASKPNEFAICGTPPLAGTENQFVATHYARLSRSHGAERRRFKAQHHSNLCAIEACRVSVGCIAERYQAAIGDYWAY